MSSVTASVDAVETVQALSKDSSENVVEVESSSSLWSIFSFLFRFVPISLSI